MAATKVDGRTRREQLLTTDKLRSEFILEGCWMMSKE